MSARDDLARLMFEVEKRHVGPDRAAVAYAENVEQDSCRDLYLATADAILAAGWVPDTRLTLVRDSVREVSQGRQSERDALAATVERVQALVSDPQGTLDETDVRQRYARIRAALDEGGRS